MYLLPNTTHHGGIWSSGSGINGGITQASPAAVAAASPSPQTMGKGVQAEWNGEQAGMVGGWQARVVAVGMVAIALRRQEEERRAGRWQVVGWGIHMVVAGVAGMVAAGVVAKQVR